MRKLLSKIDWQLTVVFVVVGVVVGRNFPFSTYLTGWDNLHPEYNFALNFWRAISGVWVENEGVGSALGHGFAASLPHTLFLWFMSAVVPAMYLRSGFTTLMYTLGVLGVYFLVKKLFAKTEYAALGGMVSATFYALNLGTVQTFFAPLESFVVMYGLLPWVLITIDNYLHKPNGKNLLWVFLLQIVFSVIGFIPPLFVAFGFVLLGMMTGYIIGERKRVWSALGMVMILGIVVLAAHAYWLMPVARYSIAGSRSYVEAKNNVLSTPDFQYMSEARGKWGDTIILRGFFIDSSDSVLKGETVFYPIFEKWNEYLSKYEWVGYAIFGIIVVGLVGILFLPGSSVIKGGVIVGFVVGFVVLTQGEVIFAKVIYLVRDVPMLGQAFRAAWTKFSGILMLSYSVLLAYGVWVLVKWWRGLKWVVVPLVMFAIAWFGWPIFHGEFFYERLKVSAPSEYLVLFKFMKTQNKYGRIVNLPMAWNWGWGANTWGYSGSGFLWYGIEQPILDRAFDVWSPYNEGFYNEFSNAIYGCPVRSESQSSEHSLSQGSELLGCREQIARVLGKYDVKYVLLDESVIAPGQGKEILRIEETKKLASELGWKENFREGSLTVWDTGSQSSEHSLAQGSELGVTAPGSYTWVEGDTLKTREDVVYGEAGTYVESQSSEHSLAQGSELGSQGAVTQVVYPFANLMREGVNNVEWGEGGVKLVTPLHSDTVTQELIIPGWEVGEIVRVNFDKNGMAMPAYRVNGEPGPRFLGKEKPKEGASFFEAKIGEGEEWEEYRLDSRFQILDSSIRVEIPGDSFVYDFGKEGRGTVGNCDVLKRGTATKSQPGRSDLVGVNPTRSDLESQGAVYVADERGAACDYVSMKELDTRLPYLMRMRGEDVEGRSLKFFLWNTGSKRNDIEWLLKTGTKSQLTGSHPVYPPKADRLNILRQAQDFVSGRDPGEQRNTKRIFDQTFTLLPWRTDGYYTLNIETRSFGQRAENRVGPVEVMYVPIEQFARARIESQSSEHSLTQGSELGAQITHVTKTGTWLYGLGVKGQGLIRLSQGYDEGWVALAVPQQHSDLSSDKAGTVTRLEHVKVDGWANGWILRPAQDRLNGEQSSDHSLAQGSELGEAQVVVIFYWPQLLEYLGFVFLVITGVGLLYDRKN